MSVTMARMPEILAPPDPAPGFQSTAGVLMRAAADRRTCLVRHFDGRTRLVEPYRVFRSRAGRRLLTCYQVTGFSRGTGRTGWKNLYLEDIFAACPLEIPYEPRTRRERPADGEGDANHERRPGRDRNASRASREPTDDRLPFSPAA